MCRCNMTVDFSVLWPHSSDPLPANLVRWKKVQVQFIDMSDGDSLEGC